MGKIFTHNFPILDKYEMIPKIHYVLLSAPLIARKAQPGQFVIVRITEKGERIPLTIADYNRDKGTITIVFQEVGKTTTDFAKLKRGDKVLDVLGPQGNPTEVKKFGTVVVVGGGVGVAPIYPLVRKLKEENNFVISIVGYRSKEYVFWEKEMRRVSDEILISTNDGSYGKKGFVTDLLKEVIAARKIDHIFAIGPAIMMKSVVEVAKEKKVPTTVSLNALMVCGMGMCGTCRVTIGDRNVFTCMEGPDFDGEKVNFDELIQRLSMYKEEEHICSCKD